MKHPFRITDLHLAAQSGDIDSVYRLIAAGVDVNARDANGNTPLKYAAAEPHSNTVRRLLESGADATLADARGFTPLHCAAAHGFYPEAIEIAELLINAGADVNARSKHLGYVPLHEARKPRMIDLLLERGADPAIQNDAGLTPLECMINDERFDDAEHLARRLSKQPL